MAYSLPANLPQRFKRESLPGRIVPLLDPRLTELGQEIVQPGQAVVHSGAEGSR